MLNILNVVGARPNFMKIAPLMREYQNHSEIESKLLHTGQHYDYEMSKIFFDELGIGEPDIYLGIGGGSHTHQTAHVMLAFEKVLNEERPDLVVVVGDVNATLACTLVASKMGIKVAHVEAGLRSFDRTMPEELNRIVTDSLADFLLTPSIDGNQHLVREGVPDHKIYFVGNIMIDTLYAMRGAAGRSEIMNKLQVEEGKFALLTLHRPSNVDEPEIFERLLGVIDEVQQQLAVVWPMHPRARQRAESFGLMERIESMENLRLTDPIGYIDNIGLMDRARLVLTDSGGLQEETTALGTPCLTIRENTERPITITEGTNLLVGTQPENILKAFYEVMEQEAVKREAKPLYWDGRTAQRIVKVFLEAFSADTKVKEKNVEC